MKRYIILLFTALIIGTLSCAGQKEIKEETTSSIIEIDPETTELLRKINSADAYEVPDLGLRKDTIYAKTAQDVEPFRHVKPFKEHFLLQMEYTGPGRAKPEPFKVSHIAPYIFQANICV